MLTKNEAVQAVWSHFKKHGIDEKRQVTNVRLITRMSLEKDPHAIDLKNRKPDAWNHVQSTFRDHWCILFETGFRSPPYDIVNVDAETGEVTVPPIL